MNLFGESTRLLPYGQIPLANCLRKISAKQIPSTIRLDGQVGELSYSSEVSLEKNRGESEPPTPQQRVEALLFSARESVPARKIAQAVGLSDATAARTEIRNLNECYDRNGAPFRIEEVAGGYMMLTLPPFYPWIRKINGVVLEDRLSQGALETLAIVAYRQPVARAELEAIRGVGSEEMLRQLMQKDLVRIAGRSEELGRPYLYGTTKRFLQLFGLRNLDRLPRSEWVKELEMQFLSNQTDKSEPVPSDSLTSID